MQRVTKSTKTNPRFFASPAAFDGPPLSGEYALRSEAEEAAGFDGGGDGGGDHRFPGRVAGLDAREDVAGEDVEEIGVIADEALDVVIFHEVGVEVGEVGRDLQVARGDEDVGGESGARGGGGRGGIFGVEVTIVGGLAHGVDLEAHGVTEEAIEGLKDATGEVFVILLG